MAEVIIRIKRNLDELLNHSKMDDIEFLFRVMTLQEDLDILAEDKYFWGDVLDRYKDWVKENPQK